MKKVVLILGTGHCGSTLLDLVLGSHSQIFSLGELNSLSAKTVHGKQDFWDEDLMEKTKRHFRYKTNRIISYDFHHFPKSKIFEDRVMLYQEIFRRTAKQILIDSSKSLFWVKRSLYHLKQSPVEPVLVLLERNPKAVINSYNRKYSTEKAFTEIVEDIKHRVMQNRAFFEGIRGVNKLRLQYEVICTDPVGEIQKLCAVLNVPYQGSMLNYWEFPHYNLSGNSGTNSLVSRKWNNRTQLDSRRRDVSYYLNHPLKIKLDQRWVEELKAEEKEIINKSFQDLKDPLLFRDVST